MKRFGQITFRVLIQLMYCVCTFVLGNIFILERLTGMWWYAWIAAALYGVMQIFPASGIWRLSTRRLRNTARGSALLQNFLVSTVASVAFLVLGLLDVIPVDVSYLGPIGTWAFNSVIVLIVESIPFWNGIARIYITSSQLGVRWRVLGAVTGLIPFIHLFTVTLLIIVVENEVAVENQKELLDRSRLLQKICATKYPVLLVHGIFFRDWKLHNYWGRIPGELEKNGAIIYYGNQQSAAPIADCGRELAERIKQICEETGCEKVNIIAHSKGGLDCRYAISKCGAAPYVASLTTVNTPHRGCEFADYMLDEKCGPTLQANVSRAYNATMRKLGDPNPDFLAGVRDLTSKSCKEFNEQVLDAPGIYYQAVGSRNKHIVISGRFPFSLSSFFVERFNGENDGLVGAESFPWGDPDAYCYLEAKGIRGISHGDVTDTNHENFRGFDVREFYVQLVSRLREKGF